jgi:hypothetical protein
MKNIFNFLFELETNSYIFAPALKKCNPFGEVAQSVRAQDS